MARTIEVWNNIEWICEGLLHDLDVDSRWKEEAVDEWHSEVCDRLERELDDVIAERSFGDRALFNESLARPTLTSYGENRFHRKGMGLGTFDDFTNDEWAWAEEIAREVAVVMLARYEELERSGLSE